MSADIKTLERVAAQLEEDARRGMNLSNAAMRSVADIIHRAIGAPLTWPARDAGVKFADKFYPGSNDLRAAFNHGVKWTVENYQPTEKETRRSGE